MNLNRKKQWCMILGILTGVFLILAIAFGQDLLGRVINVSAIIIMTVLIGIGTGLLPGSQFGIMKLIDATDDLRHAGAKIREIAEDPEKDVDAALQNSAQTDTPLFGNELLNKAYTAHRGELDRLYRTQSDFRYADVADHINQELLNHVGNAPYNDLIAGAMTGIGILGTFVGLMFGLQDFDPSTAESMMETIPPLIEGIKIAFLTSIFGVIYSIVFNLLYRVTSEDATNALEEFTGVYYEYVLPRPENDGFTKLIQYQQSQSQSMAQFAEQISMTMAEALGSSVVPTFQRIEQTIDALSDRLAKTQDQNMERIATEFVESMDKAMGSQMQRLGDSIRMICDWQDSSMEKIHENIKQLEKAGESMGSICTNLQDSISAMESYMHSIDSMQNTIKTEFDAIITEFRQAAAEIVDQRSSLTQILELEEMTLQNMEQMETVSAKRLEEEQKAIAQYRTDVTKFCEDICGMIEITAKDMIDSMNNALNAQVQNISSSLSGMDETQKAFVAEMEKASENLSNTATRVSDAVEESAQTLMDSMDKAISEQVNSNVSSLKSAQEAFAQEIQNASTQLGNCADKIGDTVGSSVQEVMESMALVLEEQVKQLKTSACNLEATQKTFTSEMQKASDQLGKSAGKISGASEDLTANLDKAMSRTYQEIDRQLAEVVRHLSGTIADIREVTERVPRMLSESNEQMQKNTTKYLSELNNTQRQMLAALKPQNQQNQQNRDRR